MNRNWIIWFCVSLFYTYQYILRVIPSVLLPDITLKFGLGPEAFGQFSGVYYIAYSLMHLPLGALLDWYGPKRVLPGFLLMTVVGTLPLIVSDTWYFPILGRALVGMGSSAAILGVFKVTRMVFPEARFGRMLSLSVTIGLMGALYGGGPLHLARNAFGYTSVVGGLAVLGILLAGVLYLMIPEQKAKSRASMGSLSDSIGSILRAPGVLMLCFAAGLMVGPLEGFADVWGAKFLKVIYHIDSSAAASLPSLIFVGMCFGGPFLTFISSRSKSPIKIILSCALTMGFAFFALLIGASYPAISETAILVPALSTMFVIVGLCCAYQILAIDQVAKQVDSSHTGLATSLANMIIMIFGYFFHGAISQVMGFMSPPGTGASQIDADAMLYGIGVIPIGLVCAALMLLVISQNGMRKNSKSLKNT